MLNTMQAMGSTLPGKKTLPPAKISIIGMPAVGKTTLTKLLRGQFISGKYNPTMGFKLGSTRIDGNSFKLWDFGGQKNFIKQHLQKYIHGTDLIFIVTDSTPKNVLSTKELIEYSNNLVEDCEIIAIANKQDLSGHMSARRVQDVLQIPTYPLVATDGSYREQLVTLINTLMNQVEQRKRGN